MLTTVLVVDHWLRQLQELFLIDATYTPSYFFDASDFLPLPMFDCGNEVAGLQKAFMRTGI